MSILLPFQLALEMNDQHEVIVTIQCPDAYTAIEVYDSLEREAQKGLVNLVVVTKDTEP
jgi:hypothetical protein